MILLNETTTKRDLLPALAPAHGNRHILGA